MLVLCVNALATEVELITLDYLRRRRDAVHDARILRPRSTEAQMYGYSKTPPELKLRAQTLTLRVSHRVRL